MNNKHIASLLGLAAFALAAVACSAAPVGDDKLEPKETDSDSTEAASSDSKDAAPRAQTPAPRPSSSAAPDASAPAPKTTGDKDTGKTTTPNADCMTTCQGLTKCGDDLSFCDVYCSDAPAVITCLAAAQTCEKADFVKCEDESAPAGDKGGDAKGGK